ncbi:MAG: ArV1 [Frankiales bacterium]|nr:ArV1 [Frankiales bacterium]
MRILAHPFRLAPDGSAVTVDADSDAAVAQLIGAMVSTVRGERALVKTFGVTDPVFTALDEAEVSAGLALHGPDVQILSVVLSYPDAMTERAVITWDNGQGARAA